MNRAPPINIPNPYNIPNTCKQSHLATAQTFDQWKTAYPEQWSRIWAGEPIGRVLGPLSIYHLADMEKMIRYARTEEDILNRLRRYHQDHPKITLSGLKQSDPKLPTMMLAYIGGLSEACRRAGLPMEQALERRYYTLLEVDSFVLEEFIRGANLNKSDIKYGQKTGDEEKHLRHAFKTINRTFGSWDIGLGVLDIPYETYRRSGYRSDSKFTETEIKEKVKELKQEAIGAYRHSGQINLELLNQFPHLLGLLYMRHRGWIRELMTDANDHAPRKGQLILPTTELEVAAFRGFERYLPERPAGVKLGPFMRPHIERAITDAIGENTRVWMQGGKNELEP